MMVAILFGLLGLFLAGFREGVWTKYTAQDVARWQAEAAEQAATVSTHQPLATKPVVQLPLNSAISSADFAPRVERTERKQLTKMKLEAA